MSSQEDRDDSEPSPGRDVPHNSTTSADSSSEEIGDAIAVQTPGSRRVAIAVRVSPARDRHEFIYYDAGDEVEKVLRKSHHWGTAVYTIQLYGGETKDVSYNDLQSLKGGEHAWQKFEQASIAAIDMKLRNSPKTRKKGDYVDISAIGISSSDDEINVSPSMFRRPVNSRADTVRSRLRSRRSRAAENSDDSAIGSSRSSRRLRSSQLPVHRSRRSQPLLSSYDATELGESEDERAESSSDGGILRSDVRGRRGGRGRRRKKPQKEIQAGVRQSERSTRARNNMQEIEVDDIYRSESEPKEPRGLKSSSMREIFETLPSNNDFRMRHREICEVCFGGPKAAPLIPCQGCSLSYHQDCLGQRTTREHLTTKIEDDNSVFQCKRCVNHYQKRDQSAPDLSKCQGCAQQGPACKPFRIRKTILQEQKDRDENDGEDPVTPVPGYLINNEQNVLFRCTKCSRAWHYHHLPSLLQDSMDIVHIDEEIAEERFHQYSHKWICKDCDDMEDKKISNLVAWRPSNVETYTLGTPCHMVNDDDKEYLIKWEGQSYFNVTWCPGPWVWGVANSLARKAFLKREDGPKMRIEDAVPEEFLRADIVLDVTFMSDVHVDDEESDRARVNDVKRALIKYKGLTYEDAVWDNPPSLDDNERWQDFVEAYNEWVAGRYIKHTQTTQSRLNEIRATPFTELELQKQPDSLVGGELMKYQMEGLNWIYYQWHSQKNGILADEMGLGKTIQVIGFMATLVQEYNLFPFLVVVPNSTVANWRREIKRWAPSLRVVTYFGSAASRKMAYKYEMYPEGSTELQCHVLVTSYETATDDGSRRVFRRAKWTGLVVDEGQRLKNDKSQIHSALASFKVPFRLLMTGTPLQNNVRELFNLLQFLDDTVDAADLEEKYSEMTKELIMELHDQIRPYILRRTKAQVLTFLPPLGQIIVPLSMSHLQKSVYKSILSKRPELLKALFSSEKRLKAQDRAKLSNILMQLRKCLCHPFVYNRDIEERTDNTTISFRNLVEASSRLVFLELLLPKLKERGHRVLIFSQFLDNLNIIEDFLDGMHLAYQRLDGTMGSLEKQKRIDQFNAADSPLFAFLLSTRAGGVGINLATADTVIILDPDYNPHQDIQAISRAHRIGQKKKVLCFQLMVRGSVEEKIMNMGRSKMALDHVIVERLDSEDIEDQDLEAVLRHGAAELFNDDKPDSDIRYDNASIDKLLDRSELESTKTNSENTSESQFSFARVWANDTGALEDNLNTSEEVVAPDPGVWDKILRERQAAAEAEARARAVALGRGKRIRGVIDYTTSEDTANALIGGLSPSPKKRRTKGKASSDKDGDDDFEDKPENSDPEELDPESPGQIDSDERASLMKSYAVNDPNKLKEKKAASRPHYDHRDSLPSKPPLNSTAYIKPFKRVEIPAYSFSGPTAGAQINHLCLACRERHPHGACKLKAIGVEHCPLCGLAHYGYVLNCPHLRSETQVTLMLEALEKSNEKPELIQAARKYLQGAKSFLIQQKKKMSEKKATEIALANSVVPSAPVPRSSPNLPTPTTQRPTQPVPRTKPPRPPVAATQKVAQSGPPVSASQSGPHPGTPIVSPRLPVTVSQAPPQPTPSANSPRVQSAPSQRSTQPGNHPGAPSSATSRQPQPKKPSATSGAPSQRSSQARNVPAPLGTSQKPNASQLTTRPAIQSPGISTQSQRSTPTNHQRNRSEVPPVSSSGPYYPTTAYQPTPYAGYAPAESFNAQQTTNGQYRSSSLDQTHMSAYGYYTSPYPAPDSVGSHLQQDGRSYPTFPTYPRQAGR